MSHSQPMKKESKCGAAFAAVIAFMCLLISAINSPAETSISPANEFSYGANIGWMNWQGDTNNGGDIGASVCSGYIYGANVGWINLGSGAPTNGVQYQNLSAGDFGVNRDSAGNLRGYAYGANVGWLNFEASGAPQLNGITGSFSGYVWGANIGWISLSNALARVQTSLPVTAPAGLVAWWPGNGNAVDVVGGNNGTLTNGVTYQPGEVQQAFNFNANSAMLLITNNPNLQLQNFTVEAWIKRSNATNASSDGSVAGEGSALLFGYGNNGYGFGVESSTPQNPYNDALVLTKVGVDGVLSSASIADTNWHHVAVTTTNGTVAFYIDGVAYPVAGSYSRNYTFATAPSIGGMASKINQNGNNSFLGSIDELSVYNRALTGGEILAIYDASAAGKTPIVPATNVWITAGDGSWANQANWLAGVVPQGPAVMADFSTLTLGADASVTFDGARAIGGLVFGDQGGAHNWHLNTGTGDPLTLVNSATGITVNNQSAILGLNLAGTQGLTKNGAGRLELVLPAGYTGGTTNNAGTLQLDGNFNTIANNPLVINAGVVVSESTLYLNVSQNTVTGSTNVLGAGTLRLVSTGNGPGRPDLNFGHDGSGVLYFGAQIDTATLDLGATQRYIHATSDHNSVARWRNWEDARINANIIGAGGLTYIAQNTNAGTSGNQPMECPLVLGGSNTFAGPLEIQRGSVYLLNPSALTQTNQLLLDPGTGNKAKFFLYGNNATVANLASGGAGTTLIANGNVENNTAPIPAATLTVEESSNTVFAGQLVDTNYEYDAYSAPQYTSAPLGLAKQGPETLTLAGASTYTGPTTIKAGTLAVNGSLASPVTVAAGATLAGLGHLLGSVTVGGTNAPGSGGAGTLFTGSEIWNPSGCLVITITNASLAGGSSLLNINGALTVAATPASPFVIHLASLTAAGIPGMAGGFNPASNSVWTLATTTAGITSFATSNFVVDTTGFANVFSGVFRVTTNGNTLQLAYGASVAAPPGLVAWWPANSNAVDVVGGNNGTLTNGVGYLNGKVGEAFTITNNHAGIFIGNPAALQLQTFTIEAWVRRANTSFVSDDPSANGGAAGIFYFGSQGYGMGMHADGAISLTKIDVDDVNDDANGARVTDTNWHHVAVTKAGTTVSFYIDGVAYPPVTYGSTFQFNTPAAIGVRGDNINANNNDSFAGAIDELSIYNRALTPAELLTIYTAGAAGKFLPPPAQIPAGTLLSDNFTGNALSSLWTLERGNDYVTNDSVTTYGDSANSRDACIEAGDNTWSNYVVTTSFSAQANSEPPYYAPYYASYIWVRNQQQTGWGQGTYYYFTIVPPGGNVYGNSQIQFTKSTNSVQAFQSPWISVAGIVTAGTNAVQASAVGGAFDLWINGSHVYSYSDTNPIVTGGIALGGIWEGKVSYYGVQVVSVPAVGITGISQAGSNLIITGTNAFAGLSCHVLATTNLALPLNQWVPVATNVWSANGNFSFTVTNAVNASAPQEFISLQTQ